MFFVHFDQMDTSFNGPTSHHIPSFFVELQSWLFLDVATHLSPQFIYAKLGENPKQHYRDKGCEVREKKASHLYTCDIKNMQSTIIKI